MLKEPEIQFNDLEIAIVENEPPSLTGLTFRLEQLGCKIVWTARDDLQAMELAKTQLPAIVFIDLRLQRGSSSHEAGWQLIRHLRQISEGRPFAIIIYSGTPMIDEIVMEAIRLGCSYVIKEDLWGHEMEIMAGALLAARSGSVFLSNEVSSGVEAIVSSAKTANLLSNKELEVLELIADGLSNREIAERQFVAVTTIKTHVSNILAKLNVDNRGKAADWFHQNYG
jgi:NarL family two-component system response regulator LiaR